jgi:glycosyltransferase involved in cell wall biosynthesis
MTIRLSVAMCTYNGAKYLEDQLRSIEQQSRPPDEVVVFDDRSTDSTADIVTAFAGRAPFEVRSRVNPRNLGTTKNFETAIRECTGDVIALADQDDFWLPQKLERIAQEFAARRDVGCVFTDAEVTDQNLEPLGYNLWSAIGFCRRDYVRLQQGDGVPVLLRRNVATGATMAFRADLREMVLPIPDGWVHDEWIAVVSASLSKISAIDEILIKYRQHSGNQIGALRETLAATISRSLSRELESEVEKSRILLARLDERLRDRDGGSIPRRIQEKILHSQARIELRGSLRAGLWKGFHELFRGRYGRYSNGLRSFVSDICC